MAHGTWRSAAIIALSAAATLVGVPLAAATPTHAQTHSGKSHHAAVRAAASTSRARRIAHMRANPARNVSADPSYDNCWSDPNSSDCMASELAAINRARALEGVKPMVLPPGYADMTPAEQTFVVTNLERVDRHLRPFIGMVDSLNAQAAKAATRDEDPQLASWTFGSLNGWNAASNWADDVNALGADYDWMYNDGYSAQGWTANVDCTSPSASGCWGHRENILMKYHHTPVLVAGVAEVQQGELQSTALLMVGATGRAPSFDALGHQI